MNAVRRSALYLGIALVVVAAVFGAALAWSESREWLLWELGPVQVVQALTLLAAVAASIRLLRKERADSDERPVLAAVLWLMVVLFWREAEPDYSLLGYHAFSWKYLVDGSPIWIKIGLGVPSVMFTVWVLRIVLPRLGRTLARVWQRRNLASPRLLVLGLGLLAVAQLWDKAAAALARAGVTAFSSAERDPLPEELLELCGELTLLFCVVELAREVAARRRSLATAAGPGTMPQPAQSTRTTARQPAADRAAAPAKTAR